MTAPLLFGGTDDGAVVADDGEYRETEWQLYREHVAAVRADVRWERSGLTGRDKPRADFGRRHGVDASGPPGLSRPVSPDVKEES